MDRTVFHITPSGPHWHVLRDGEPVFTAETKHQAVTEARAQAHEARPSQIVIHTADGKIEDEATYDTDPFPPRG